MKLILPLLVTGGPVYVASAADKEVDFLNVEFENDTD